MKNIFKKQIYHLLAYVILGGVLIVFVYYVRPDDSLRILGLTAVNWIVLSWIFAGIFLFWIMMFWRLELYAGKIGKWFGSRGFLIFKTGFTILGMCRFLSLIPASMASSASLNIPAAFRLGFIFGTVPFVLWGLYSVIFYFGINRAFGADHFFPEYKNKSLEKRGIYRFIPNSMYTVVLLLLYYPGFIFCSQAGLVAALLHHLFVWCHYFCTEKPDMKEIYKITQ